MANESEYYTRIAPQDPTDILIQIVKEFDEASDDRCVLAFSLGHCLQDWVNECSTLDGVLIMSDDDRLRMLRASYHLDRHAKMIRDTLMGPIMAPSDNEGTK